MRQIQNTPFYISCMDLFLGAGRGRGETQSGVQEASDLEEKSIGSKETRPTEGIGKSSQIDGPKFYNNKGREV